MMIKLIFKQSAQIAYTRLFHVLLFQYVAESQTLKVPFLQFDFEGL